MLVKLDSDRDYSRRRVVLVAAAAATVVVVIVAAVGIGVWMSGGGHSGSSHRDAAAPTTTQPPGTLAAGGTFEAPTVDQYGRQLLVPSVDQGIALPQTDASKVDPHRMVETPPSGTAWEKTFGVPMPYSTSDGPSSLDNGVADGFTKTPQGGALAAYQILRRIQYGPQWLADELIANNVVGSSTAKDYMRKARSEAQSQPASILAAAAGVQIDAVQSTNTFVEASFGFGPFYGPDDPSQQSYYQALTVVGVYDGGQWKLSVPDTGIAFQDRISALAGWAEW